MFAAIHQISVGLARHRHIKHLFATFDSYSKAFPLVTASITIVVGTEIVLGPIVLRHTVVFQNLWINRSSSIGRIMRKQAEIT